MFKNLLFSVLLIFPTLIITTLVSCSTTTEKLDGYKKDAIEQSTIHTDTQLNKLKEEVANQQAAIESKTQQVSKLQETKTTLSNQLSEKTAKLNTLENKLNESKAKLIETQQELYQVKYPIAIMSSDNEIVTFASPPKRIITFDSSSVEILFDIGESEKVVATHAFATHPKPVAYIPKVGDAFNLDLEAIIALEPDLVFVFYESNVEPLRNIGLKVLYIETLDHDFEKTTELMEMWGRITNNMPGAAKSIKTFNENIESIRQKVDSVTEGPRIFQDVGGLWTPGKNTLVNEVFNLLKTDNIAKEIDGYAQISPEIVVEKNPEIILTPNPQVFLDNQAYKNISAVKNRKVYSLKSNSLSVPGPRFPNGIREIAALIYPERFENVKDK